MTADNVTGILVVMKLPTEIQQAEPGPEPKTMLESKRKRAGKTQCSYVARSTKKPCKLAARPGSKPPTCSMHGPNGAEAARRNYNDEQITRAIVKYDPEIVEHNPLTALSEVSKEVLRVKDLYAAKALELADQGRERYQSEHGLEQLRGEMSLYERALDRAVSTLATIAKLNIDERLAKVSEAQIMLVDRAITAGLVRAGLDAQQQRTARIEIAERLRTDARAVTSG